MSDPAETILRTFASLERAVTTGLPKIFDQVEEIVYTSFARQFASEGAEFGNPWARLTPGTIEEKARRGAANPARILVMSERLQMSLTQRGGRAGYMERKSDGRSFTNTRQEDGRSLLRLVERKRKVRHPVDGIGPRGVARVEQVWNDFGAAVERVFVSG